MSDIVSNPRDSSSETTADEASLDRYVRQMRFAPLGESGQRRLAASSALICGCGALGSVIANTLARAGVGKLRIVDRDFLELNNLQRQVLYDERDVADGLPKAIAAKNRLAQINSQIEIEAIVADVDADNIASLAAGMDLVVDGTDNFETRFLINDFAVKNRLPWVYGGCIGAEGQSMTIVPGETACLRCLMRDAPPPGSTPTCDAAGILSTAINVIASIESTEAIKILSGNVEAINRDLTIIDLWDNRMRQVKLTALQEQQDCPACTGAEYPWLAGERASQTAVLCGRNAVQLSFADPMSQSLSELAAKLEGIGSVQQNPHLLRFKINEFTLTVFPDGRAIVGGTEDISEAKTLYAKYIGA